MKKTMKKATIVAMAAIAGTSVQQETEAMRVAMRDMAQDMGHECIIIDINNSFDGFCA